MHSIVARYIKSHSDQYNTQKEQTRQILGVPLFKKLNSLRKSTTYSKVVTIFGASCHIVCKFSTTNPEKVRTYLPAYTGSHHTALENLKSRKQQGFSPTGLLINFKIFWAEKNK
jgi:hypothetical protein